LRHSSNGHTGANAQSSFHDTDAGFAITLLVVVAAVAGTIAAIVAISAKVNKLGSSIEDD
jgi:hypothetical protein